MLSVFAAQDTQWLLLLRTAPGGRDAAREQRLFEELRLALDDFAVLDVRSEDPGFVELMPAEQLKAADALARRQKAAAIVWLATPSSWELVIHVIGTASGQHVMQSIDTRSQSSSAADLALSTRELLGAAKVMAPVVAAKPAPPAPAPTPAPAPAPEPVAVEEPAKPGWGLALAAAYVRGALGVRGAADVFSVDLSVEPPLFGARLRPQLYAAVSLGPWGGGADAHVDGTSMNAGLGLSYAWELGGFAHGPLLRAGVAYRALNGGATGGPQLSFSSWTGCAQVGWAVRWKFWRALALEAVPAAAAWLHQQQLFRPSDRAVLFATPWVDVRLSVGLRWDG